MPRQSPLRPRAAWTRALGVSILLLCAAAVAAADTPNKEAPPMFTQSQFDQLDFLLGDWRGTAPDGNTFHERYQRGDAGQLQSLRFATDAFAEATDGSTLVLRDGRIEARWGEFTWQASRIGPAEACFDPVNAPGGFCWRAEGPDRLTVTQRWTGADGAEQSMVIAMTRVAPAR
jgi:hypothetical protein